MLRQAMWMLFGMLAALLGGELLFRALPVSSATRTGYTIDPQILTYPAGHEWTTSNGWDLRNVQRLRANNLGFLADRAFVRDGKAVGLVGDSYVEAGMLAAPDRPGAQLEGLMGHGRPVYALGGPGSALLDYAERIRFAHEQLGVRDFVVLMERGDVMQSLCGSGNVHGPCLDPRSLQPRTETLPPAGLLKRVLRESALAQYVISQLKVTPAGLWSQALAQSRAHAQPTPAGAEGETSASIGLTPVAPPNPAVDAVTTRFFERVRSHVPGRLVIVIDSDRERIRAGLPLRADPNRARFIELARAAGADGVETQPLFAAHYRRSPLRLEVGPYDGHMNPLGVHIVMAAAAQVLNGP